MKKLIVLLSVNILAGCSALSAVGIGANDILPSLKMCQEVQYARSGIDMEVHAKCKVPAG